MHMNDLLGKRVISLTALKIAKAFLKKKNSKKNLQLLKEMFEHFQTEKNARLN